MSLPTSWIPPFFVLSPAFHRKVLDNKRRSKPLIRDWRGLLELALATAGLAEVSDLYLRSNAVDETIDQRGRYQSILTSRTEWLNGLETFFTNASLVDEHAPIGILVQEYIPTVLYGQLSNERMVAEEYRDALIELVDAGTGSTSERPLSFRRWRNQRPPTTQPLICRSAEDISSVLREPLALAANRKARIHYEWAWNGKRLFIVQADIATGRDSGESPEKFLRQAGEVTPPRDLILFRLATAEDQARSAKLRNHRLYERLGAAQPPLFFLGEKRAIRQILSGRISASLASDLEALTQRPLVIRTSCAGETMLPRSDLLLDASAARAWLVGQFRDELLKRKLRTSDVTLLAHHFIPALSAAYSLGQPRTREVYVEALWGIPEGLYYYPFDSYLVDTQYPDADRLSEGERNSFTIRPSRRFKSYFIAPDDAGRFGRHQIARPWDWSQTLDDATLTEMALFTRRLAAHENRPVKVMWFAGCPGWTGLPRNVPWYHDGEVPDQSAGQSPYQRNMRDELIDIRTSSDLAALETHAKDGYRPDHGGHLVIHMNPAEDQVIRDPTFAERVGKAAAALDAIVELRGGILSHVYYTLIRTGAHVSVRNAPNSRASVASFNKLVRDQIPLTVAKKGERAKVSRLRPEELAAALRIKLVEEAFEVKDADSEELIQEVADVLEVVDSLAKSAGLSKKAIQSARAAKRRRRGGFSKGVLLHETSAAAAAQAESELLHPVSASMGDGVIESAERPSLEGVDAGAYDYRLADDFVELVHSAEVGLSLAEWVVSAPRGVRIDPEVSAGQISWQIEGRRRAGQLQIRLKITIGTRQLLLPLSWRES